MTTASNDGKQGRSNAMYVSLAGILVVVLVILLIVFLVRRGPR